MVVGYEYQHQKPIFDCYTARDWCGEGQNLFQNSLTGTSQTDTPVAFANPLIPGQPHLVLMGDHRSGTHPNGLLSDRRVGATRYRFNDAGTSFVPYGAGQFSQVSNTRSVLGGEGRPTYEMQTLMPDIERNVIYTHFNYDVTDNLKFFTDFSYGKVDSANQQAAASTTVMCIRPDNAYLGTLDTTSRNLILGAIGQQITNGALAACNTSGGAGSGVPFAPGATLTKDFRPQQEQGISNTAEATRIVTGVEGAFANTETWIWDAYYQYGKATRDQIAADYVTTYRFQMALDSVINPLTGQPDCRVNVAAPGTEQTVYPQRFMDPFLIQGCVPLNPFGQQMSEAAHDYAFDPLEEFNTINQQVLAGSVNGQLWQGWGAGPLLAAAGMEYRYEKMENDTYKDRPREHSLDTEVAPLF